MIEHDNNFVHCTYENQVLHITFKNELPTDDEWLWAKTTVRSYYTANIKQGTRFSIVCDMLQMPALPLHRIKDWVAFLNDNKKDTQLAVLCSVYVIHNTFVLTSIKLFFLMYKAERPIMCVKTVDEATQFVAENQGEQKAA